MSPLAACLLALALVVAAAAAHASPPPCSAFLMPLIPCAPYITDHVDSPPLACCSGAKSMASLLTTRTDRVAACKCFKAAAGQLPGIDYGRVSGLPDKCHIHAQFNFTPDIDCDR